MDYAKEYDRMVEHSNRQQEALEIVNEAYSSEGPATLGQP